jgi:hypothetical protein
LASNRPFLLFPEVVLKNTLDTMLKFIRQDALDNAAHPENSFLHRLLENLMFSAKNRYEFIDEAKNIFLSDPAQPHAIVTRLFFDPSRAGNPTIHFDLPSEDEGENGLGMDRDDENALYTEDEAENIYFTPVYRRRFKANYNIICTAASPVQTLLIYNVVRAWLLAATDHLTASGLEDPHLSGNDLLLKDGQAPVNLFARAIRFRTAYELQIPALLSHQIATSLTTPDGTDTNPTTDTD